MEISGIQDYSPGLTFYKMIIKAAAAAVRSCYMKHQTCQSAPACIYTHTHTVPKGSLAALS